MKTPVGIIVALPEETQALLSVVRRHRSWHFPDYPAWRGSLGGSLVTVVQSGMGHGHAAQCARTLIKLERPKALIVAGFAGALDARIRPGDAVVASEVVLVEEEHTRFKPRLAVNHLQGPGIHVGAVASPDRIMRFHEHKQELAGETGAIACDMESGSVVREAEAAGIPWLVVRAVTDALHEDLPMDFARFTNGRGLPHKPSIVLHALSHPQTLLKLIHLGKRTSRAASTLAYSVERILSQVDSQLPCAS